MSDQDYKAGEKGLAFSVTMDAADYEAGKSVFDGKQAIAGTGVRKQTGEPGSGAGVGLILLIPLFPFLYPVAGVAAVASFYFLFTLTDNNSFNGFLVLVLVFGLPIAVFLFAKRWETKVAGRFLLYRLFRMVVRFVAVTVFTVLILSASGDRYVTRDPGPGAIVAGLVIATLSQFFIFRRLDRWEAE